MRELKLYKRKKQVFQPAFFSFTTDDGGDDYPLP